MTVGRSATKVRGKTHKVARDRKAQDELRAAGCDVL